MPNQVSGLLNCALELVEVLISGPEYVAYSIFDSEREANPTAMAVATVSGGAFDSEDEGAVVRGAELVVRMR